MSQLKKPRENKATELYKWFFNTQFARLVINEYHSSLRLWQIRLPLIKLNSFCLKELSILREEERPVMGSWLVPGAALTPSKRKAMTSPKLLEGLSSFPVKVERESFKLQIFRRLCCTGI